MADPQNLSPLILEKLLEQAERIQRMTELVPEDRLDWRPAADSIRLGEVLGHLLECFAGVCAALQAAYAQELAHFAHLRQLPVDHICRPSEARERIGEYVGRIKEGFELLRDEDLSRRIPTAFVSAGEPLLTILLGNLEHLINHKYQLFFYLKLLGVQVGTPDLYRLRGESE